MKRIKNLLTNEKGTVTILVAVAMVAFAGFTALVADAGLLYITRAKMVDALDSAVLAGVQKLPDDPQAALALANEYAVNNGLNLNECSFEVDNNYKAIQGWAQREVDLFFARAIGHNTAHVSATSGARVKPITGINGIVPFGVIEGNFNFGEMVTLKEGAGDNDYSGWFGALALGKGGSSVYEKNIKDGYDEEIKIGDIIPVEEGNMSGATKKGIEYRIDNCNHSPRCSIYQFKEGCNRILMVPIIRIKEINNGGHPSSIEVVSFAAFLVDSYAKNGNESIVRGAFINYVVIGQTDDEESGDFGLYGSELFR